MGIVLLQRLSRMRVMHGVTSGALRCCVLFSSIQLQCGFSDHTLLCFKWLPQTLISLMTLTEAWQSTGCFYKVMFGAVDSLLKRDSDGVFFTLEKWGNCQPFWLPHRASPRSSTDPGGMRTRWGTKHSISPVTSLQSAQLFLPAL